MHGNNVACLLTSIRMEPVKHNRTLTDYSSTGFLVQAKHIFTWAPAPSAPWESPLQLSQCLLRQSRNAPVPTQTASSAAPTAATSAIHHLCLRAFTAASTVRGRPTGRCPVGEVHTGLMHACQPRLQHIGDLHAWTGLNVPCLLHQQPYSMMCSTAISTGRSASATPCRGWPPVLATCLAKATSHQSTPPRDIHSLQLRARSMHGDAADMAQRVYRW